MTSTVQILAGDVILLVGMVICGLGAWSWGRAISAAHQAHSHGLAVKETRQTLEATSEAAEEIRERARAAWDVPSDADLHDAVVAEREAQDPGTFDTLSNEGIQPSPPIMEGGFYRTGGL